MKIGIRTAAFWFGLAMSICLADSVDDPPIQKVGTGVSIDQRDAAKKLEALVNGIVDSKSEDPIHNAAVLVQAPGFSWQGAAGVADGLDNRMTANHKFKIASIGKTFTATVVLQLVEEGLIGLDETLEGLVDPSVVDLDTLHLHHGVPYGRQITIGQLLGHTSGLRDYMEDPRFVPFVMAQPDVQWSPSLIFEKTYEWGVNERSAFPPGEGFEYSDLNYVLLAMVIEKTTGSTLAAQYTGRIFEPLGMSNSYLEFYQEPRGNRPLSHAFFGQLDVSASINTSFDWGGGGIVSTCQDLNVFFRALLDGRLFEKPSTLTRMLAEAEKGRGGEEYDYGLGIMKREIGGVTFYGHGGAYDCDFFYSPDTGVSVCTILNQMNTHGKRDPFVERAVALTLSAAGLTGE